MKAFLKIAIKTTQFLALAGLMGVPCHADSNNANSGFMDFNLYPYLSDVDNDTVFTVNLAATLYNGFFYFSLTNFSNQSNEGELADTVNFYSEQNIRWRIADHSSIDLTFQSNFRSGANNDRHRLGFRWRLNNYQAFQDFFQSLNLNHSINFHLLQFDDADENIVQMEHVFRFNFPGNDRLYVGGFIDQTFNEDLPAGTPSSPIVGEVQLGYRIIENLYAVGEYRINEYRRSDVNNFAAGVEYLLRW